MLSRLVLSCLVLSCVVLSCSIVLSLPWPVSQYRLLSLSCWYVKLYLRRRTMSHFPRGKVLLTKKKDKTTPRTRLHTKRTSTRNKIRYKTRQDQLKPRQIKTRHEKTQDLLSLKIKVCMAPYAQTRERREGDEKRREETTRRDKTR